MLVVIISAALVSVLSVASTQNADIDLSCDEPPDIEFASVTNVTDEGYALGSIVTYVCQHGYSFSGESRTIFCDESDDGVGVKWSEPQFFCAPRSCGDPGYVSNARRIGSRFTFPNFVKFECDEGYKIKGVATRYCQTSGLWSGRLPACKPVICNQPKDIDNGHVTYNSLEYSSELKYTCDSGFKLNTDEAIFCTANGQWSKVDVACIESVCDAPMVPEHGSVRLSSAEDIPRSGTIALYSCDRGKVLYGSATSKCLDDGRWLFPPPECLVPCSIPNIANGKIGKYQKKHYYSQKISFNEMSAGRSVEDDEELVLLCSEGYVVESSETNESKISCSRGKWSLEPKCAPAPCLSKPPNLENAEIVNANHQHGGKVIYSCLPNFKKTKEENVFCSFGEWKGISIICESTSCLADNLHFDGLRKGYQTSYNDGDIFKIECNAGYQVAQEEGAELKCVEGKWVANTPPCLPAGCGEPPAIPYTTVEKESNTWHGSYATYVCEDPYKLIGNPKVQCLFGQWENLPRCEEGRCDVRDLSRSSHIFFEKTPRYVQSEEELHVTCKEGYSPRLVKPYCLDGKWIRNTKSPCREDDCLVPKLEHGKFIDKVLGDEYWSFWEARYVRVVIDREVPFGTLVTPGTNYYLYCDSEYSFQGSSETQRRITCTKGKWNPSPDCIPRGTDYNVWTSIKNGFSKVFNKKTTEMPEVTPMSPTTQSTCSTTEKRQPEVLTTEISTTAKPLECSCWYPVNDENLVATVDGKQLHYQEKVKDGSVVLHRCHYIGYHRLRGPQEIKCENCKSWHSSEFPTCSRPSRGDAIIVFDSTRNITAEGNLEVRKGQNLTLTCIAYEGGSYPSWTVPTFSRVTISKELKVNEDRKVTLYMSHLEIYNADLENEGQYNCTIKDNTATRSTVNVIVIDPSEQCPELPENGDLNIVYENERRVESKATVSCKHRGLILEGKAVLKCLRNGSWSHPPPQCHDRKCKMLKETDLLKIVYQGDREIGSLATFHCSVEAVRTGVATARCMENKVWSHPTPTCEFPPCALKDIFPSIPRNVEPDLHKIHDEVLPYNTKITLTCPDDLIAIGDAAVKCEKNRTWKIQDFQCRSGCPPIEKKPGSKLQVVPEKKEYSFADFVEFSCPKDMDLTTDLQTILCMKNGWSETTVPDCKEKENSSEAGRS